MLGKLRLTLFTGLLLIGLMTVISSLVASPENSGGSALLLTVEGAITPATVDYLDSGLREAEKQDAELLILQLNTPGGLDSSTRDLISKILNSNIPVVTWVAPAGARAASAGTYILYGSHVAAMASATHLGSATPVSMGGGLPGQEADEEQEQTENPDNDEKREGSSAMERKVLEDAVSYIRNLADRHGRNADWAEKAVRDADNLTASEALEMKVIDLMADSRNELLSALDGREVVMAGDEKHQLATADLSIINYDPDWRTRILSIITDPTVAYFLMILGFYGLIFELSNPGSLFPGILGTLSLLLALYAFQVLPVNYAGLALIFFGIALIIAEAFAPSFGILGIGGILAFVSGSVLLMDSTNIAVSLPLIGGVALIAAGFLLWAVTRFMGLRKRRPTIGEEAVPGESCVALESFTGKGKVRFHGEIWTAKLTDPQIQVKKDEDLKVIQMQGLTLQVEPVTAQAATDQHST
ncbi:nodulation protein NfeD [Marinospirillum sp.]|uniref:NfeD family protein n=1 Tax=Marinospirillum sp. TaxID=2183934 RepID=UPI0028704560|nr:nodulation protein NfeD [Marinospirillum sp.]MDR9468464.1 nodulation protein NfeD [Marinospirillum sp.]